MQQQQQQKQQVDHKLEVHNQHLQVQQQQLWVHHHHHQQLWVVQLMTVRMHSKTNNHLSHSYFLLVLLCRH